MLQNPTWIKDLFKVQDRPMEFNRTNENLTDFVLESTLQLTSKKLPFKFWHNNKEVYQ